MGELSLFAAYDVLFVLVLTAIYLIYSYTKKEKADSYVKFILIFLSAYFLFCYSLSFFPRWGMQGGKHLFLFGFLPLFTLCHAVIPFKKNQKVNKGLIVATAIYVSFFLFMVVVHRFSDMG